MVELFVFDQQVSFGAVPPGRCIGVTSVRRTIDAWIRTGACPHRFRTDHLPITRSLSPESAITRSLSLGDGDGSWVGFEPVPRIRVQSFGGHGSLSPSIPVPIDSRSLSPTDRCPQPITDTCRLLRACPHLVASIGKRFASRGWLVAWQQAFAGLWRMQGLEVAAGLIS